jgi:predicted  nucleic acid-binding Zn-ribbon protein
MAGNKLLEFRSLEAEIAELQSHLASLQPQIEVDRQIQSEIDAILAKNGKKPQYLLELYGVVASAKGAVAGKEKKTRRAREVKSYVNPHTNEVVDTKGGNNRTLKMWKQEHGAETVEGWLKKTA